MHISTKIVSPINTAIIVHCVTLLIKTIGIVKVTLAAVKAVVPRLSYETGNSYRKEGRKEGTSDSL